MNITSDVGIDNPLDVTDQYVELINRMETIILKELSPVFDFKVTPPLDDYKLLCDKLENRITL